MVWHLGEMKLLDLYKTNMVRPLEGMKLLLDFYKPVRQLEEIKLLC